MIQKLLKAPTIDWQNKFDQKLSRANDQRLIDFYAQELPHAETPLGDIEFVAMDFETTGLDPDKNDIVSIGLVPFNLNRIYLRRAQQWMVRPRNKLGEDSVIIHGITHSEIRDAPDLNDILNELLVSISGKILVVHYRNIEREFLDKALRSRIGEGIEFPVLDTMFIENQIQHRKTGGIWNRLKGVKPESVRLAQSRRRYGLPDYTPHHALTDAIATAELLQAQIAYHYASTTHVGDLWL